MAWASGWAAVASLALAGACGKAAPGADAAAQAASAAARPRPAAPAIPPEELTVVRDLGRPFAVRLPRGFTTSVTTEGTLEADGAQVTVVEFVRGELAIAVRPSDVRDPSMDEVKKRMKVDRRVKVKWLREKKLPDGWALAWERRDPGVRKPLVELAVYRRPLELMCSASELKADEIDEALATCATIQPYVETEEPAAPREFSAEGDCPKTCHLLMRCQVYGDEAGCTEACKGAGGKDKDLFRCFAQATSCDGVGRCQGE